MRCFRACSLILLLAGCGDDKTGEIVVTRCVRYEVLQQCVAWERRCYTDGVETECRR